MKTKLIIFIVVVLSVFLWKVNLYQKKSISPTSQLSFSTPAISPSTAYVQTKNQEGQMNFLDADLEVIAKEWAPTIAWAGPTTTFWDEKYYPQPIPGKIISGSIVAENFEWHGFNFLSYDNSKYGNLGWTDGSIAADRPGASQWGYQRMAGETTRIIVFDYLLDAKIEELEPGLGGVKFVCPCTHRLSVFLSDSFPTAWANAE